MSKLILYCSLGLLFAGRVAEILSFNRPVPWFVHAAEAFLALLAAYLAWRALRGQSREIERLEGYKWDSDSENFARGMSNRDRLHP